MGERLVANQVGLRHVIVILQTIDAVVFHLIDLHLGQQKIIRLHGVGIELIIIHTDDVVGSVFYHIAHNMAFLHYLRVIAFIDQRHLLGFLSTFHHRF